jgi:hypothetical protein
MIRLRERTIPFARAAKERDAQRAPQASNNNATHSLVEIMILTSEKILEIHHLIEILVERTGFFARAPSIIWWTRSMHNKISFAKLQLLCIS